MSTGLTVKPEISVGFKARELRCFLRLTQQELANLAGVSAREVNLFEHYLPVRLDAKRRLLKELWGRKAGKVK